uniref:Uncharacterized protein n=1 Tax=Manihot esculenta TaxID=3983 RepID=A0A2C9VH19_MANES
MASNFAHVYQYQWIPSLDPTQIPSVATGRIYMAELDLVVWVVKTSSESLRRLGE